MKQTLTDQVLAKIDFRSFYSSFTRLVPLAGKDESKGLCPLHQEKTPSFFVNLKTGSFHCFGCGQGGGPVQFYTLFHGIDATEALKRLAREFGVLRSKAVKEKAAAFLAESVEPGKSPSANGTRSSAEQPELNTREKEEDFSTIYTALLQMGQSLPDQVIAYFDSRKIRRQTLADFHISFLEDPKKTAGRLLGRFDHNDLVRSGLFTKSSNDNTLVFQFLRHPLLIRICRDARPAFVQGRRFQSADRNLSKYCNLARVPVPSLVNLDKIRQLPSGSPVVLCEGAPDTMILDQEGFSAVGVIGSGGFKSTWVGALERFHVIVAFDNDEAGIMGNARVIELFHTQNRPVSRLQLPEGVNDVNEFFLTQDKTAFQRLLSEAEEHPVVLSAIVRELIQKTRDRMSEADYAELGERIYSWFEYHGGVFAVDEKGQCFLLFDKRMYEIGNNAFFNGLMHEKTNLIAVSHRGKMIWELLRNLCVCRGRRASSLSWIHCDQDRGIIYINLHNDSNEILRLGSREVGALPNGSNSDQVLLRNSDKMEPIHFDAEASPREAVEMLDRLVMRSLTCEPENRFFTVCWLLGAFFLDYTREKALLKLSGGTQSGKTTAARILSCLLYGNDWVELGTVAYYYAEASRHPYLICDNLETEQMNRHMVQFLLHVATGVHKGKRRMGTDSETVYESANTLVAITAIEPLTKSELINRAYDVEFRSIFKQTGFMQNEHLNEIIRHRSYILSGLFTLFSRQVLPGLQSHRREILATLRQQYPNHSKERVDTFLTLMIVILKALLGVLEPDKNRTWDIVDFWINYQKRLAQDTERDTNAASYLLDALSKEMLAHEDEFYTDYYLKFSKVVDEVGEPQEIVFMASAKDLMMALQVLSKNKGFRLPFSNPKQLSARLNNENAVLEQAGWTREHKKIVRGVRYYEFRKKLV